MPTAIVEPDRADAMVTVFELKEHWCSLWRCRTVHRRKCVDFLLGSIQNPFRVLPDKIQNKKGRIVRMIAR
jgi:hypothetical protein